MSLPMHRPSFGSPAPAKFEHENGVGLRMQAFLAIRDGSRRVAAVRLQEAPDAWFLPGELMMVNEDPQAAAERVARNWFATPLAPRLSKVLHMPATGPDDPKWYLVFLYEADAPADGLKGTPDTLEIKFAEPGKAPGPWGASHGDVWRGVA